MKFEKGDKVVLLGTKSGGATWSEWNRYEGRSSSKYLIKGDIKTIGYISIDGCYYMKELDNQGAFVVEDLNFPNPTLKSLIQ